MKSTDMFRLAVPLMAVSLAATGAAPKSLYTDLGDGTVKDNKTGLIWQQGIPQHCYGDSLASAQYCCTVLRLGKFSSGWRLPTKLELETLVDVRVSQGAAIDYVAFPGTIQSYYWTSTPYGGDTDLPWKVNFGDGTSDNNSTSGQIRCVHD